MFWNFENIQADFLSLVKLKQMSDIDHLLCIKGQVLLRSSCSDEGFDLECSLLFSEEGRAGLPPPPDCKGLF